MLDNEGVTVTEFIDLINQTYEFAYPIINIIGELANFRVSKNKWVYFDLKDEYSCLKFFGTVYQIRSPLEDGMMLRVSCNPRMHNVYGFSMQIQGIELIGEGTLKRAAEILQVKLTKEGIFDMGRKKPLPYPPSKIGLITSSQSAAYHDFINIINTRWRGVSINLIDVQVQGNVASRQIVNAIEHFNNQSSGIEVLVLIRGGGSPEDLATFNTEEVTRSVASSNIPMLVAIGHEIDISLAELAADRRASTPSHAAEVLVPDTRAVLNSIKLNRDYLNNRISEYINLAFNELSLKSEELHDLSTGVVSSYSNRLTHQLELLNAYDPRDVLKRGYSIVRKQGKLIRSASDLRVDDILDVSLARGSVKSSVKSINET